MHDVIDGRIVGNQVRFHNGDAQTTACSCGMASLLRASAGKTQLAYNFSLQPVVTVRERLCIYILCAASLQ